MLGTNYNTSGSHADRQLRIKRRAPSINRVSEACIARLQAWISDCVTCHHGCQLDAPPRLPSRVIDVGSIDGKIEPRLVLSNGENEMYAALSHCWGLPSPSSHLLKTEMATLQERLRGIPIERYRA